MDKNSSAYKAVLLAVVCAVAGVLLAGVNAITAPLIEKNALKAVESTLEKFFPNGNFSDVTSKYVTDEYDLVDGVYEAKGEGYVFTLHNTGYDAGGFTFAIAFANDGSIVGYEALEQNETAGRGSLAFEGDYVEKVKGLTSTDEMPLISGATITTKAVRAAVTQAETIFNKIQGIAFDASASSSTTEEKATTSSNKLSDVDTSKASCTESSTGVYACKATGLGPLTATVTVKDGAVVSITDIKGSEVTDGYEDAIFDEKNLKNYVGATLDSEIDAYTGATLSDNGLKAMVSAALQAASK